MSSVAGITCCLDIASVSVGAIWLKSEQGDEEKDEDEEDDEEEDEDEDEEEEEDDDTDEEEEEEEEKEDEEEEEEEDEEEDEEMDDNSGVKLGAFDNTPLGTMLPPTIPFIYIVLCSFSTSITKKVDFQVPKL